MALPVKTFSALVADMVTAWANAIGLTPSLQPGDALYATMQSVASQMLFLEAQAQIVNLIARAQTSSGADLDTFMAQFGFTRLPPTFMTGVETFGKLSASPNQYLIPAAVNGVSVTIVQTPGGAVKFMVVADSGQPTWNASLNAYVMAPNQTTLNATIQAITAGASQNVTAGQLSQIATNLPGIDTATNPSAINNGVDAESDDAFRARFVLYLNSLSKATKAAIQSAIEGVQQGIQDELLENIIPGGSTRYGAFTAVVDDGSGDPPDSLLNAIFAAVDAVRGFTILPAVVRPTLLAKAIALNIKVVDGFDEDTAKANAKAAVIAAVNALPLGSPFVFINTINTAAGQSAGVESVEASATTIDGSAVDYALTEFQRMKVTGSNVTVGTY